MEANPRKLYELLFGGNQFVIPVFQRKYVWKKPNWERLWDDIQALRENGSSAHFMGSIVTVPYKVELGTVPQYVVIDGQQRMITLVVLLAAIRDEAKGADADTLPEQVQKQYLIHEFASGDMKYKVFPRLLDRDAFFDVIEGKPADGDASGITDAYRFFRAQIAASGSSGKAKYLKELFAAVTQQLAFVSITLDADQNPWAIFETLNARGVPLKQGDLIRNHMFMRVPLGEQDEFDEKHWRPFEQRFEAGPDGDAIPPEDFYRDFLMRRGTYVRPENTYLAFQRDPDVQAYSPVALTAFLTEYLDCYAWIHRPHTAPSSDLARELSRLRRLDVTATYPLVLNLLWRYHQGEMSAKDAAESVRAIQSYHIRRSICGWSTTDYARAMPGIVAKLDEGNVRKSLICSLAAKGWPADEAFAKALPEYPVYKRYLKLTRVLLLALEDLDTHKEKVDVGALLDHGVISIEHVMPQSIGTDKQGLAWREMLGENWQEIQQSLLHSIGNLTLTGYNTKLSNGDFDWKREEFAKSKLALNSWFSEVHEWNADAIRERGRKLTDQVIAIWPSAGAMEPAAVDVQSDEMQGGPTLSWDEAKPLYLEFWEGFQQHLQGSNDPLELMDGGSPYYVLVAAGMRWSDIAVIARASKGDLTVQLQMYGTWSPTAFNLLRQHTDKIEADIGKPVTWVAKQGSPARRIELVRPLDLTNKSAWPEQYEWAASAIHALVRALTPLLGRKLPLGEAQQWTEPEFYVELGARCPAAEAVARRIVEWAVAHGLKIAWGNWTKTPLFTVMSPSGQDWVRLFKVSADNGLSILFAYLAETPAFASEDSRAQLLKQVNAIAPFDLPPEVINGEPVVPLTVLSDPETRAGFLELIASIAEGLNAGQAEEAHTELEA
jgi:uncharacterized protein with ParB-like and HNH nuclease domain